MKQGNRAVRKLYQEGKYREAAEFAEPLVEFARAHLGEKHPDFATTLNNLAALCKAMGDYAQAEALYRQALEIRGVCWARTTRTSPRAWTNLAGALVAAARPAEAFRLMQQALAIDNRLMEEVHARTRS